MVWISLGLRAIINVEALNMVESVGNVTRHRKAAIVYRTKSGYVIRWVPAISGETMAHAYQAWIAELAKKRKLPICSYCSINEFVKHSQPELFGTDPWEQKLKQLIKQRNYDPHVIEVEIIKNCVVEDIGGFLFPGPRPVKRTSRFSNGYLIPAIDAIEKVAIEPQFHVRHAPKAQQAIGQAQMIYYVEVGSAIYTWTFALDIDGIGRTSMIKVEDVISNDEKIRRIECAIDSLALMLDSKIFGAKLTRFNPLIDYESIVVTISHRYPFNVSPPSHGNYIKDTLHRSKKFSEFLGDEVKVLGYRVDVEEIEKYDTIMDLMAKVKDYVKEFLKT